MTWRCVLVVTACLALAACEEPARPGPQRPGELRVAVFGTLKGLDPVQADEESSATCVVNVFDQLYQYHPWERPHRLMPCLAAALPEVSSDGTVVTIRLRTDATYVDDPCFEGGKGRRVTAHDVAFCMRRLVDPGSRSGMAWLLEGRIRGLDAFAAAAGERPADPRRAAYPASEGFPSVEGIEVKDDATLVLRLAVLDPDLAYVFAAPALSIYPPEAVARYGADLRLHAVTSGPYAVASITARRLELVRRTTWRDERVPALPAASEEDALPPSLADARLPLNERVVVEVFEDDTPRWQAFLDGRLDHSSIPKDRFLEAVDAEGRLRPALAERGVRLRKEPRLELVYLAFNHDDSVLGRAADEKGTALRRAISLTLDEDLTRAQGYNGRALRVEGPIVGGLPEHDPTFINPWKRAPEETQEAARDRARKLLADAGLPGGKGVPVLRLDTTGGDVDMQFAAALQRDLRSIGLRVEPHVVTWQEQIQRQRTSQFQLVGLAWGADYPSAQNFLQLFYGPNRAPGPNSSNYRNPAFDALYDKALGLPAGPERTALWRQMERIVVDDVACLFQYRRVQWTLVQPWLTGYRFNDLVPKTFAWCRVGPR
jgi:ABC-type transport system substrate-binding protein